MQKSAGKVAGLVCLIAGLFVAGCQAPSQNQGGGAYNDHLDPYTGEVIIDAGTGLDAPGVLPPGGGGSGLRVGDLVVVSFADTPNPMEPHREKIKEDGTLTLPLIGSVVATNKTTGELQREIHKRYVPGIFRRLTVTVSTGDLFFTVSGEVRTPSRQAWINKITLVQAIASAGGFTDYANEKKVQIIRSTGRSEEVNYRDVLKDPSLDVDIYPGDRIIVPKRWF